MSCLMLKRFAHESVYPSIRSMPTDLNPPAPPEVELQDSRWRPFSTGATGSSRWGSSVYGWSPVVAASGE